ncbi:hypothetical protein PCASD_00822 [Puccinia coronata f. sp. avenae]|uniref:Mid2 domain-containing protein n=1 Tax=Puccinia coronata f. sp. avenae TaxID=200324 RepID=A0A2N5VP98_9BASI|nr:hypothetical protein PCASD_00822 [Puccinia coronata f. sp. avenae]
MPQRAVFLLAYRLLTYSLLLNVGLSTPILNVEVVSLAKNGETTSAVVLPNGASKTKTNIAPERQIASPVSLIEKIDNSNLTSSSSSGSTVRLVNTDKTTTNLANQTSVNGTDQVVKLIERPSNGKSFFADQTPTKSASNSQGNQETNPAGLDGTRNKKGLEEAGIGVRLLSEKPMVASPGGPIPVALVSRPSEESTQTSKSTSKSTGETRGEPIRKKKDGADNNKENSRKDPKVNPSEVTGVTSLGKDAKPLTEKPTTAADSKEEINEATSFLSVEQNAENHIESESQAGLTDQKQAPDKSATPQNDAEGTKKNDDMQRKTASKEATEDKTMKTLPTIDSEKDLRSEPVKGGSPPVAPKTSPPSPPTDKVASPPTAKSTPGGNGKVPEPPSSKEDPAQAPPVRLAGKTATTLSVVKDDKHSDAHKEDKPEEKHSSKLLYMIGAGGVGFFVLLVGLIIFARRDQKKGAQLPEGAENSYGAQSEKSNEFGSGGGAKEITVPLSPPMSLSGKSERGISVALPTPRGDEDLSGGKSFGRQLRSGYERGYGSNYGSQYGRDNYGQYESDNGSVYNESEFYDNSRQRGGRDTYRNRTSDRMSSPRTERGRFPYSRR